MKKLLVLSWFCVAMLTLHGQKYMFTNYSVDDGLAQTQVRSLFQDSRGDLWIGTLGGVSRFDGQKFENFNSSSGLLRNQVNAIIETKNGEVVLGTQGGISIFNGRSFTNHQFDDEYTMTNDMVESGDSLIMATSKGLYSYRKGETHVLNCHPDVNLVSVKTVLSIENGLIILTANGIYAWTISSFEELFNAQEVQSILHLETFEFMDIEHTSKNEFYITTSKYGLLHIHDKTIENISTNDGLASNVCSNVSLDKNQNPLVCTLEGFSHLKQPELVSFNQLNGLDYEDVRVVLEDETGTLWVGTNGGGLFKFSGYAFTYFDKDAGLSSEAIMNISRLPSGEMLYCTYDAGVCIAGEKNWNYLTEEVLTNSRVWTHTTDSSGLIYLGTSGGIDVIKNNKHLYQITTEDGLSYRKVTALYTDSKNQIWIGTSRGIDKLVNGKITNFSEFAGSRVRDILETQSGQLYVSSRQGVWKKQGEEFILEPFSGQLKVPLVYCLEEIEQGLVLGTTEGLFLANDSTLTKIEISNNYSANIINFIHKDVSKNLWVGTNFGLYKIDPNLDVTAFTRQDGLVNLETNLNSAFSDEDALWFGTSSALHKLDFNELERLNTLVPPSVKLNEVMLNLEHTDWTEFSEYFNKGTKVPLSPVVGYENNNFQFQFSTNTLDKPEKLVYQFMLDGYDQDWLPVTESSSATYTNLPYSSFDFKVRAKRLSQPWGEPLIYKIKIIPPFWQTWWFILVSSIVIIYGTYSVFQYRRKNLITQLEKEKFELKSKMLSLEQQSLNSSMNRHFIFNALNSIQYYINRQDRLAANKYLSSFAKLIRKNLDSSQVNFTTLADELERLELYLEIENMRFKDKFEYNITVSDDIDEEATQIPSMLLQPYLENSIWHGILPQDKKGLIILDITKNPLGQMEIRIKDNGIGIHTSQAQKIGKANHISKGMKITTGRIQLLQNLTHQKVIIIEPFELKDTDGNVTGTQVTLKLPLKYNKEQIE